MSLSSVKFNYKFQPNRIIIITIITFEENNDRDIQKERERAENEF